MNLQSMNKGDSKYSPRLEQLNSESPANILTRSQTLKTDGSHLPQARTDTGTKSAKPKTKPTVPTRISIRKLVINDQKVLKRMEATAIYSKISRASMIKRLRAFEAIDSGRLATRYEVQRQFGVTGHQVTMWVHKREMIEKEATEDKNLTELRSVNNFPVELELSKYCIQCLELKQDITKENLLKEAHSIAERMGIETFVTSPLWLSCFMTRNAMGKVKGRNILNCDINNMLAKSTKALNRSSIKNPDGLKRKYLQSSEELESPKDVVPKSKKKKPRTDIEVDPLSWPENEPEPTRPLVFITPKPCRFCLADVNEVGGKKIKDLGFRRLKHWIAQHIGYLITPVANEDEFSEYFCFKCINVFVRWMGCFGDISKDKWHPHEIESWTAMRHSTEVSTQTASLVKSELVAGNSLMVTTRKIKTELIEPIPCIKLEPIEEVSIQLMDLQDVAPSPICDVVPDADQTEDPLNYETCDSVEVFPDTSVDGSLETTEVQDTESSDFAPEVIGFAALGTDYVSEETIDASGVPIDDTDVAVYPANDLTEVSTEVAQLTDKVANVAEVLQVADKTRPLVFAVANEPYWVENLAKFGSLVSIKVGPQPLMIVKQKRKSTHLIRNNCDGKPTAPEIANKPTKELQNVQSHSVNIKAATRRIVPSVPGLRKLLPRILQKEKSSTKVADMKIVTAPSSKQRRNLVAVLKVPLGEKDVPALRNDAAEWEKKSYTIMSNLEKSMSDHPKCLEKWRMKFHGMVKENLNCFKGGLMTSKYETPLDFLTDIRKTFNCMFLKAGETESREEMDEMLASFEVQLRSVISDSLGQQN